MTTYLVYLIPNLLSEAVIFQIYIERMEQYQQNGDNGGQFYLWAVIFRKVFIYTMPEIDPTLDNIVS